MVDIVQDVEIEYTRENAKTEFKIGNYSLAKNIYETLWDNSNKDDANLLFEYGRVLRKVNESETFIEVCREIISNENIMSNKRINSTLCWCLYD